MMNEMNWICLSHKKFVYHMKNEIHHFKYFEQYNIGNTNPLTIQPKHKL